MYVTIIRMICICLLHVNNSTVHSRYVFGKEKSAEYIAQEIFIQNACCLHEKTIKKNFAIL